MGNKTTTTTIVIDGTGKIDLLQLLNDVQDAAARRLGGPTDAEAIEVSSAMQAAARTVFLSPERIEALRETLSEVYRAMEQARRTGR